MVANMQRLSGAGPQAAKSYIAAAAFYKRPVQRWQLMMMAINSPIPEDARAQLYNKYIKQLKTAQDRIPWMLGQVYNICKTKNPKMAMAALKQLKKYSSSGTYGSIMESMQKEKAAKK